MVTVTDRISYSYGECSLVGKLRGGARNEDSQVSYLAPSLQMPGADIKGIFCIADGYGGPGLGDAASRETVKLLKDVFLTGEYVKWAGARGIDSKDFLKVLRAVVCQINFVINNYARKSNKKMGTTLEVLVLKDDRFYLAHVGNSRIYMMRKGIVYRLTQDHVVDETTGPGPQLSLLGSAEKVTVDVFSDEVHKGDSFVLCSDGLTKSVTEEEIRYALVNFDTPQKSAEKLARLADRRDGSDDISVTVIQTTKPGREVRPPVKAPLVIPEIKPKPGVSRTVKVAGIVVVSVILVAMITLVVLGVLGRKHASLAVGLSPDEKSVIVQISDLKKGRQYLLFRLEGKAFKAKSRDVPVEPKSIHTFETGRVQYIDKSVEPGKTYFYTVYRSVPDSYVPRLDLKRVMIRKIEVPASPSDRRIVEGPDGTGNGDVEPVESTGIKTFTRIYNQYENLEDKYVEGLTGEERDDLLGTLRDYKKKFKEIDRLIRELEPLEKRTRLLIADKDPSIVKSDLGQLKSTMQKNMANEGIVPYLAALRRAAVETDFADAPNDLSIIKDEVSNTVWSPFTNEFEVLLNMTRLNEGISEAFTFPRTVIYTVEMEGETQNDLLGRFFSEKELYNKELIDRIYNLNADLVPGKSFSKGDEILIPNPEFERGGKNLISDRENLLGEGSPFSDAMKAASSVNDTSLRDEYTQIARIYRAKVLLWEAVTENSRALKRELLNLDTLSSDDIERYRDSYVRRQVLLRIEELEAAPEEVAAKVRERIKQAADELDRLGRFLETEDPEKDPEAFFKALKDFVDLGKRLMAAEDPAFQKLKEAYNVKKASVDYIVEKLSGPRDDYVARANKLVAEASESSRLPSGYDTAIVKLEKAVALYERAVHLTLSEEKKPSLWRKINAATDEAKILKTRITLSGIKKARWNREISQLSFTEVLIYLEKLTAGEDEIISEFKEKHPQAFSTEVDSIVERIRHLKDLSVARILRRLDPSGNEFDQEAFKKAVEEFKFLSFALTAVVEDPRFAAELETDLADLTERMISRILLNHMKYEGAHEKLAEKILEALDGANNKVRERFGEKISHSDLRSRLLDNEGKKYFDKMRDFASSIGKRLAEHPSRRESYFVEVLLPSSKDDDALEVARTIWDNGHPLLRLRFISDERYLKGRNFQLAVGWYRTRQRADEALSEIRSIPGLAQKYSTSLSVRQKSEY